MSTAIIHTDSKLDLVLERVVDVPSLDFHGQYLDNASSHR